MFDALEQLASPLIVCDDDLFYVYRLKSKNKNKKLILEMNMWLQEEQRVS